MDSPSDDNRKWYAVQTRSNMEKKAVESLKRQIDIEDMGEYISKDDILLPTETVSEIKNGKKRVNTLKKDEIERIFEQINQSKGTEKPKVSFEVGEEVKINDGPFVSLTGRIDEIDPERGKLKVSVSIFGRFTPVELEYWQVTRAEDSK